MSYSVAFCFVLLKYLGLNYLELVIQVLECSVVTLFKMFTYKVGVAFIYLVAAIVILMQIAEYVFGMPLTVAWYIL